MKRGALGCAAARTTRVVSSLAALAKNYWTKPVRPALPFVRDGTTEILDRPRAKIVRTMQTPADAGPARGE